jgi:hypothetical protein
MAARDAARQAAVAANTEAARLDADARAAGDEDESAHGDAVSDASDAEEASLLAQLAAVRAERIRRMQVVAQVLPPGGAQAAAVEAATPPAAPRLSGPQPKAPYQERYKGEAGIALDKWISSASVARKFFTGMDDATAPGSRRLSRTQPSIGS